MRRRKKKSFFRKVKIIAALGIICVAAWFLFFSNFMKVQTINAESPLNQERKNEVQNFVSEYLNQKIAHLMRKDNIIIFYLAGVKNSLADEIKKQFPDIDPQKTAVNFFKKTLTVMLEKKQISFIACEPDKDCWEIDNQGIAINKLDAPSESINPKIIIKDISHVIKSGSRIVSQKAAEWIPKFQNEISIITGLNIQKLEISSDGKRVSALVKNEAGALFTIYAPLETSPDNIIVRLKLLLDKEIKDIKKLDYVDFRVQDKAFYKLNLSP